MENVNGPANINLKSRIKQILILGAIILLGIIISQSVQAQDYQKSKAKHFKTKYKAQIKLNYLACTILAKKRLQEPKRPLFAFLNAKPKPKKYKPQAEVDAPSYVRIYNGPILASK